MVEYQGAKMSKSLGNLVLVREVLDTYSADALRLYLFSHHYRSEWEYIDDELDEWSRVAADLREAAEFPGDGPDDRDGLGHPTPATPAGRPATISP